MRAQTRVTLLLLGVVLAFSLGLLVIYWLAEKEFHRISAKHAEERQQQFEQFLQVTGTPMEVMTRDNTHWDALVDALTNADTGWAAATFTPAYLNSYDVHAVWILDAETTPFFSVNNLYSGDLENPPLTTRSINRLFESSAFAHFFLQVDEGLLEVRGATIHPSRDSGRVSPRRGYLLAGRLWSNAFLRQMELLSNNELKLLTSGLSSELESQSRLADAVFDRALPGPDGEPVAHLVVRSQAQFLGAFAMFGYRLLWWQLGFATMLLLGLAAGVYHWINRPLRLLSKGLEDESPAAVIPLEKERGEFGRIARLIQQSLWQREQLLQETAQRISTEAELHHSQEELRQSQKMEAIGRLAGGVAHDFNNLLTVIIGYAQMIIGHKSLQSEECRRHAELIQQAGHHAAELTHQLLAFSRKQLLQPKVIDLNELVLDTEKILRRLLGERIQVELDLYENEARVLADPTQLQQVIMNLSVNALDAMNGQGQLRIRTGRTNEATDENGAGVAGDYVCLDVADTGAGMDEQTLARIFEPFFTTKETGKGTGLGLSMVYGLIKQSRGHIFVVSEPGKGAEFRICLPYEEHAVEEKTGLTGPALSTRGDETVMVVEDEEIVRELLCEALKEQGYHVLCAANGKLALEIGKRFNGEIALLVTDVVMPEMTGPELARQILGTRPALPVLFVSGYSHEEISQQGILGPNISVMQKPFTPNQLASKVRDILDQQPLVTR